MDINSLLSPSDSSSPPVRRRNQPYQGVPRDNAGQFQQHQQQYQSPGPGAGGLSGPQQAVHHGIAPSHQPAPASYVAHVPAISSSLRQEITTPQTPESSTGANSTHAGKAAKPAVQRHVSTPGMDTLADIASMQHRQRPPMRQAYSERPKQPRKAASRAERPRATTTRPSPAARNDLWSNYTSGSENLPHRTSSETSFGRSMPSPIRSFTSQAISAEDSEHLQQLAKHVAEHPTDFRSHTSFIDLLQKGLRQHLESSHRRESFELLAELRRARDGMDKHFPVGEDFWCQWLTDETLIARGIEEHMNAIELFSRAVSDEPSSVRIWRIYGDYMFELWSAAYLVDPEQRYAWTNEERGMAQEVFQWETVQRTWENGINETRWDIQNSNVIWDRFMEILISDLSRDPSASKIQDLKRRFEDRLLKEPHATWDNTFQSFSSFLSNFDNGAYEETMAEVSAKSKQIKLIFAHREPLESNVIQARNAADTYSEWSAFSRYLDWEIEGKGVFSSPLIKGLYERFVIRFPTDHTVWCNYIEFLIENKDVTTDLLSVIRRACRHCPWSGDLWAHQIMTLEAEGRDFHEIEDVKHTATATGLLDHGNLEELMKIYVAWCGCLRRRAFEPGASEEQLDIAEVGIRSALDYVKDLVGDAKRSPKLQPDRNYRLERIYIKFLTQRGDVLNARQYWHSLVPSYHDSYDFWYRFYIWEMVVWANFAMRASNEPETQLQTPREATLVLEEALRRHETINNPEDLLLMYVNHCEQHESVQVLRQACITMRRLSKDIAKRREHEAAQAVQAQKSAAQSEFRDGTAEDATLTTEKRKRESDDEEMEESNKKARSEDPTSSAAQDGPLKRDRENTTVYMGSLPLDVKESRIRQFFQGCGTIKDIAITTSATKATATVEFAEPEDALYAQSRATKPFDGHEITIDLGMGTTIWVTNYPPTSDEAYMRKLFADCGEVTDVRFPSLQGNARRRFCYIQFATAVEALAAVRMDGTLLDEKYKLSVKISNPAVKADRSGALNEGREVIVQQLHWHAVEVEIREVFRKYGTIETIRIPKKIDGKSKGVAFVVFSSKEEAEDAVAHLEQTKIRDRAIHVAIAKPQAKRSLTVRAEAASPTASDRASPEVQRGSVEPSLETTQNAGKAVLDSKTRKERTCALLNVADTVNIERLQVLLEPFGVIQKLTLRPDHSGAMIEFAEEKSIGLMGLGIEGKTMDGLQLRVGSVEELLQSKPITKETKSASSSKKAGVDNKKGLGSGFIARPRQAGHKPRTIGGGAAFGPGKTQKFNSNGSEAKTEGPSKSNDDFRKLFAGPKPSEQKDGVDSEMKDTPAAEG